MMKGIQLRSTKTAIPRCYCYSTPTIPAHDGWVKIGYTEQDDVEKRICQQLQTAHILHKTEWSDIAVFADGKTYFHDSDFHAYLQKQGIKRMEPLAGNSRQPEWFQISGADSLMQFTKFRQNQGVLDTIGTIPYTLREEQEQAVAKTLQYFQEHSNSEFLWNAKPRFGKTLAAYDLCKRLKAQKGKQACNILIVTNRPAIANSWYEDYVKFLGTESGFRFVSEVDALKGKPFVLSRKEYTDSLSKCLTSCIEFVSLQDLKGSLYFGGQYNKLQELVEMPWELLVIDEAHEAIDTTKTDIAFRQIKRAYTLHLSGTPFKALANGKFPEKAIFNWTYADEQRKKRDWNDPEQNNPYENLPKLNLYTYQMSEMICDELKQGVEIDGEKQEYAFDLNEFFSVKTTGSFVYEQSVDQFLEALTKQEKYPFSTPELRDELRHTFWILNRVESAKALAKKLKAHPVFGTYEIVLAAGDGRLSEEDEKKKAYEKVRAAIDKSEKTITLSVGQLTTGITVPEWTAVLMLSNMKSPALYMQTAFRSQNPWRYQENGVLHIKKNAYVFDFDPARTLLIFEEFSNDLSTNTAGGKGDSDSRKQNVRELLNFFPVIGEDASGEMIELDAEQVLSIPRKIRSLEVVRRGFMSNFLFQNISSIFNAPAEVVQIIQSFPNAPEGNLVDQLPKTQEELNLNDEGEVELSNEFVIGKSQEIFGDKIYDAISDTLEQKTKEVLAEIAPEEQQIKNLQEAFHKSLIAPVLEVAAESYGSDLNATKTKNLKKQLEEKTKQAITQECGNYSIQKKRLEAERNDALEHLEETQQTAEKVQAHFEQKMQEANTEFQENVASLVEKTIPSICEEIVKTVETQKQETTKKSIEDDVREHLRGFARTIPSFLMAYGNKDTTLASFDTIIPEDVFHEVTSITLAEFRFLRDGGSYTDANGETKQYPGKLFDPVVFDDSIQEFLALKERLSNYFDDSQSEDIFDYIPPQKTNQIFTPKHIVKQMVDMLEQENPNCFDDPDKTFIDLYMKSGLYLAEIVKRLYNSKKIIAIYPDQMERLKHIFEKQVYGLAPTKIIYQIAVHYILGFDKDGFITEHNLRQVDALPHVKNGTLQKELDFVYGE